MDSFNGRTNLVFNLWKFLRSLFGFSSLLELLVKLPQDKKEKKNREITPRWTKQFVKPIKRKYSKEPLPLFFSLLSLRFWGWKARTRSNASAWSLPRSKNRVRFVAAMLSLTFHLLLLLSSFSSHSLEKRSDWATSRSLSRSSSYSRSLSRSS